MRRFLYIRARDLFQVNIAQRFVEPTRFLPSLKLTCYFADQGNLRALMKSRFITREIPVFSEYYS